MPCTNRRRDNLGEVAADARLVFIHGDVCDRPLLERAFGEHDFDAVVLNLAQDRIGRAGRESQVAENSSPQACGL